MRAPLGSHLDSTWAMGLVPVDGDNEIPGDITSVITYGLRAVPAGIAQYSRQAENHRLVHTARSCARCSPLASITSSYSVISFFSFTRDSPAEY